MIKGAEPLWPSASFRAMLFSHQFIPLDLAVEGPRNPVDDFDDLRLLVGIQHFGQEGFECLCVVLGVRFECDKELRRLSGCPLDAS